MPSSDMLLADRYVHALFELAQKDQLIDQLSAEVTLLDEIIYTTPTLMTFLANPAIGHHKKQQIIRELASRARYSTLLTHFLFLLNKNNRLEILPEIIAAFKRKISSYKNQLDAYVVTAEPLSESQYTHLKQRLAEQTGQEIVMNIDVDKSILGGLIVTIGSKRLDDSLLSKIDRLKTLEKQAIAAI